MIYLLLPADEWEAKRLERYVAAPGAAGFVHCCDHRQVQHVKNAFFPEEEALVALGLDPTVLIGETRYEPGARGEAERFPHVYGPIRSADVIEVTTYRPAGLEAVRDRRWDTGTMMSWLGGPGAIRPAARLPLTPAWVDRLQQFDPSGGLRPRPLRLGAVTGPLGAGPP